MSKIKKSLSKVLKFGGTSVGTSSRLKQVVDIILTAQKQSFKKGAIAVCVSAMSGTTKAEGTTSRLLNTLDFALERNSKKIEKEIEHLTEFHKKIIEKTIEDPAIKKNLLSFIDTEITSLSNFLMALVEIREVTVRSRDRVISVGEILSARILTDAVNSAAKENIAKFINLNKLIPANGDQETQDEYFFLNMEKTLGKLLTRESRKYPILILTGFVGKIPGGIVEVVGRGYTDFTASMAASGTGAASLEIWKEVDGIFSADPKKLKNAHTLKQISYIEAGELTFFGTEAIHPRTMEPCIRRQIPILVKNVLNPNGEGTIVNNKKLPSKAGIGKALTQKASITIINIESNKMNEAPGFIYRMGEIFHKHRVSIDLMATSEVSVSITVHAIKKEKLKLLKTDLSKIGDVTIMEDLSAVSIIGHGMQHKIGAAGAVFSSLGKHKINIILISQGASELSISFIVNEADADKAIEILHKEILKT